LLRNCGGPGEEEDKDVEEDEDHEDDWDDVLLVGGQYVACRGFVNAVKLLSV
jgi:hypothetical protein